MTITEFLTARLDEDEAIARGADGELEPWTLIDSGNVTAYDEQIIASVWIQNARHIARFDPARALADVAAKRAIVAEYVREEAANFGDQFLDGLCSGLERSVRLLAQPYAEHPDFDQTWRV